MDAKSVKSSLKAAREAIRNKEFKDALQHCKAVLTEDKNNYMALVLVAVGSEGLEQYEQALKAYKRAIDADNSQLLAWQGLSSFYEKHQSPEYVEDRFQVYFKLIELHQSDEEKRYDTLMKVANLVDKNTDPGIAEKVLSTVMVSWRNEASKEKKAGLQGTLIQILQISNVPENKEKVHAMCKDLIGGTPDYDTNLEPIIAQYLADLPEGSKAESIYNEVYQKFPQSLAALEHFIIHKLDLYSLLLHTKDSQPDTSLEELTEAYEILNSVGPVLPACKGCIALWKRDFVTSRKYFAEAVNQSTTLVSLHVFASWTSLKLHQNEAAISYSEQGLNILTKKNRKLTVSANEVTKVLKHIQTWALYSVGGQQALEKALQIIQDAIDTSGQIMKGLIYNKMKDFDNAGSCLVDAPPLSAILQGQLLEEKGKPIEALESYQKAVEMEPSNPFFLLHLAKCQFRLDGQKQESFQNLLKAAKQDPYDSEIFLYLGHYYKQGTTDVTRARKCYQKAFDLDPSNDEAGEVLCDLLNKEGEEEQARKILLTVTTKASAGCAKWAWLRLGLFQLKTDDPSIAIASLQAALRADPKDTHVWECLGEAYYARGSYTAALKAFNRASELNTDSMYCLFQMASIKQALAMYTEAAEEYKLILQKSPNYVPALKGLGETYNLMARSYLSKYLHGRARDKCQEALHVLIKAASFRPDMSCLWKLAGDSCTIIHVLPNEDFRFEKTDNTSMTKLETLQFGGRCYIRAVKIYPECSSLWHDLGMNYFYQSKCRSGEIDSQLIEKSVQAIKKAIELEPGNYRHWNALGFIACSEGYHKPSLAQHCFIKSIQAEQNNVVAWTNLASLYLKHENVKLAHEAFKIAQRLEPSYVSCWIGQAIIAEIVGHEDAMDLFRHTTDLGNHLEGALGYSHWVCTMLQSKDTHESYIYQYAIEQMAAVPASIDALAKYTDRVKTNAVSYNMYGLLLERQKLFKTAAEQFKCAIDLLAGQESALLKEVLCNYARVLCACGDFEASSQVYETIDGVNSFVDLCQSALAFYKCGKLEQSFQAYNNAAELASSELDKSHVLAAVSMVIYKFGNPDEAKTKLFESTQTGQPSVHGLKALCSLGLLQSDATLAAAALQELYKQEGNMESVHRQDVALLSVLLDNLQSVTVALQEVYKQEDNMEPVHRQDVALLSVLLYNLQDMVTEGLRRIQRQLMKNPLDPDLWHVLSTILLRYFPDRGLALMNTTKTSAAIKQQFEKTNHDRISLGQLSAGLHSTKDVNNNALKTAQRSVLVNPGAVESWSCLATAIHAEAILTPDINRRKALLEEEFNMLTWLLSTANLSLGLKMWCHKQRTICSVHVDKHSDLLTSLEQLLSDFGSEREAQQWFEMFQHVMKGDIKNLGKTVQTTDILYCWQILLEMYLMKGLIQEGESVYNMYMSTVNNSMDSDAMLIQLIYSWYQKTLLSRDVGDHRKFEELTQLLDKDSGCQAVLIMRGILNLNKNMRQSRNMMEEVLGQEVCGHMTGSRHYSVSVARRALIYILNKTKKDQDIIQKIASEAEQDGDEDTLYYLEKTGL